MPAVHEYFKNTYDRFEQKPGACIHNYTTPRNCDDLTEVDTTDWYLVSCRLDYQSYETPMSWKQSFLGVQQLICSFQQRCDFSLLRFAAAPPSDQPLLIYQKSIPAYKPKCYHGYDEAAVTR